MHVGGHVFAEQQSRFALANSTLVWHDRRRPLSTPRIDTRIPERMHTAHAWAQRHHCEAVVSGLGCHEYRTCSGVLWRRCAAKYESAGSLCPTGLIDLTDPPLRGLASLRAHAIDPSRLPTPATVVGCHAGPAGNKMVLSGVTRKAMTCQLKFPKRPE